MQYAAQLLKSERHSLYLLGIRASPQPLTLCQQWRSESSTSVAILITVKYTVIYSHVKKSTTKLTVNPLLFWSSSQQVFFFHFFHSASPRHGQCCIQQGTCIHGCWRIPWSLALHLSPEFSRSPRQYNWISPGKTYVEKRDRIIVSEQDQKLADQDFNHICKMN